MIPKINVMQQFITTFFLGIFVDFLELQDHLDFLDDHMATRLY